MNRVVYVLPNAIALILMTMIPSLAQSVPRGDRLSPSTVQRLSRDLIPSSAQDFFNAGQTHLEKEILLLTQPRSPLKENLLTVHQGTNQQTDNQLERPSHEFLRRH